MITPSLYKTLIHLTWGIGFLFQIYSRGLKKKHAHLQSNCNKSWSNIFSHYFPWTESLIPHQNYLYHKWSGRNDTKVNVICMFWKKCVSSTTPRLCCIPCCSACVWPLTAANRRRMIPEHPVSHILLFKHWLWAAVLFQHFDLDLCLIHMVFFLNPGCKIMQNASRIAKSASLLLWRGGWWSCWVTVLYTSSHLECKTSKAQQPSKPRETISCSWAPSAGTLATDTRTATSTCPSGPKRLRLLFRREGQGLPSLQRLLNCFLTYLLAALR